MKKISEHLGEIIIALAGVALLIAACVVFKAPIGNFFNNIITKETSVGNEIFANVGDVNLGDISSAVTHYTAEEIAADDHLYSLGPYDSVVVKFNEDYSAAVVTLNGDSGLTEIKNYVDTNYTDSPFVQHADTLTSVKISKGVTNIGSCMFYNCSNLKNVTVSDSVTTIGVWAFFGCTSLENAPISNNITAIGNGAFKGCKSLKSETIPEGVTSIDGVFSGCTNLSEVTLPYGVTSIGKDTFAGTAITGINIPESVTSIGQSAFSGAKNLLSVSIPEGVTSIGNYAFYECVSLESAYIPSSVTSIGDAPFYKVASNFTIHGEAGSYAEAWAATNGYTFVAN